MKDPRVRFVPVAVPWRRERRRGGHGHVPAEWLRRASSSVHREVCVDYNAPPMSDPRAAPDPPQPAPAAREPSLLPREHGAWGQLALPLVSALALGRPGAGALLLTAAVVLAFLAHEPLVIVLGQRGRRVQGALDRPARRRLALVGSAAVACGAAGLLLRPEALLAVLPAAALGAASVGLVLARLEKTTLGEILVAFALTAASVPVALAAGAPARDAWASAATWAAAFAAATLPVRAILLRARTKGAVDRRLLAAAGVATIAAAALLAGARGWLPRPAAFAVLPVALAAFVVSLAPIRPQRLTQVGWTVVGASTLALLVLVIGLRLAR
jgi:YwiC-like protein